MDLVRALTHPDTDWQVTSAVVATVNADGTVVVDVGGGRSFPATVLATTWTPTTGAPVEVVRRDHASFLVLGPVRTANPTTTGLTTSWSVPYNVFPAPPGGAGSTSGTLTVNMAGTGSWRDADGWSQNAPYQGAYSPTRGYYRGCYFPGSTAFDALDGRTCTSLTIHLARHNGAGAGGVGSGGLVPQLLALHAHPVQPGSPPTFTTAATTVGSLSDAAPTGTFTLPLAWGQALIDGTAGGIGHLSLSSGYYSRCQSLAEDPLSGQLVLGWAT